MQAVQRIDPSISSASDAATPPRSATPRYGDASLRRANQIRRSRVRELVLTVAISIIITAFLGLGAVRCIIVISDALQHGLSTPSSVLRSGGKHY